ncbi:HTH_Tnp_Tc3_2 domain-containing protein [Trichonephila clavipes]|nr:HTH_Tnp_Tc3_2 domain-containing protein [Trichonephila clavipes]
MRGGSLPTLLLGVLPQNCEHLAPCRDEFRGPRSSYVRQDELRAGGPNLVVSLETIDDVRELIKQDCDVTKSEIKIFFDISMARQSSGEYFCVMTMSKEEISEGQRHSFYGSTTSAEDRYIVLSAKRNRRTTAQQVANQFLAASGKQISRKTVARRLRGGGLYARRPVVCVPLTRQHRTSRLQWRREHHNLTEQDWPCVLFSDESRFSLSSDCRRQLIWCENGTAYHQENIQEKNRYPTCSIMV